MRRKCYDIFEHEKCTFALIKVNVLKCFISILDIEKCVISGNLEYTSRYLERNEPI